jgi:hypothetical protein
MGVQGMGHVCVAGPDSGDGGGGDASGDGACPSKCNSCKQGGANDGGAKLTGGVCTKWCSRYGYCGATNVYKQGGTDCTGCGRDKGSKKKKKGGGRDKGSKKKKKKGGRRLLLSALLGSKTSQSSGFGKSEGLDRCYAEWLSSAVAARLKEFVEREL